MRTVGIILAMLLHHGIEVPARGGEIRPLAHAHGVNVDAMHARRQSRHAHVDAHALGRLRQRRRAYFIAFGVDKIRMRLGRRGLRECRYPHQYCAC